MCIIRFFSVYFCYTVLCFSVSFVGVCVCMPCSPWLVMKWFWQNNDRSYYSLMYFSQFSDSTDACCMPVVTLHMRHFCWVLNVYSVAVMVVMSCAACVWKVDHAFTAVVEPRVTPLVNAIFLKYSSGESPWHAVHDVHHVHCVWMIPAWTGFSSQSDWIISVRIISVHASSLSSQKSERVWQCSPWSVSGHYHLWSYDLISHRGVLLVSVDALTVECRFSQNAFTYGRPIYLMVVYKCVCYLYLFVRKCRHSDCYFFKLILLVLLHFAWVVDDAKCIVVTAVCVSVPRRMPTLLHGPGCNLEDW